MNENEKIKEAIDGIEPKAGAKERMLENIRRKAALQAEENADPEIPEEKTVKIDFSTISKAGIPEIIEKTLDKKKV